MSHTPPAAGQMPRRVLVVVKISSYQQEILERKDLKAMQLLSQGHPSVSHWISAHEEQIETLNLVQQALSEQGAEFQCISRSEFTGARNYDLAISIGGDGTFLTTAHGLEATPLLGVNSSISSSHGHWCLANKNNFRTILAEILKSTRKPVPIMRLQLSINGNPLPITVINEAFICHPNPAGTSHFYLEINGQREVARSSGLFVGPAAGSTGWMRSAGAAVLPVTSDHFQFLVREPHIRPGETPKLLKGLLTRAGRLKIVSAMELGKIYIDGQHNIFEIARGDKVLIKACPQDLLAFISPQANEGYPMTS